MCVSAAGAAGKEMVLYYSNEKTHPRALQLLKYMGGLPEINSLLYFCQFYLPDDDVSREFQLKENTVFTLRRINTESGSSEKV